MRLRDGVCRGICCNGDFFIITVYRSGVLRAFAIATCLIRVSLHLINATTTYILFRRNTYTAYWRRFFNIQELPGHPSIVLNGLGLGERNVPRTQTATISHIVFEISLGFHFLRHWARGKLADSVRLNCTVLRFSKARTQTSRLLGRPGIALAEVCFAMTCAISNQCEAIRCKIHLAACS